MQKLEDFETFVGKPFEVALEDGELSIVLNEVTALKHGSREGGGFSMVFEGPDGMHLEQGLYALKSGEATVEIFLVPIGPYGKGMGFEAVFT